MGVTTTKTNKPINPRGNDSSPLKYNRAALYSGKALDFDGVNDVVNITTSDLDFGANDFSVSAIVRLDGSVTDAKLVYLDKGSTLAAWQIRTNPTSNRLVFQAHVTNTGWTEVNFDDAVLEIQNDLTHLTFVRVGSAVTLYINGALYGSGTGLAETLDASNGSFAIGNRIGSVNYWGGLITQHKIFSGALTAAQVDDLYNNPEKVVPTGVDNTALKLWLPMQEGAGTTAINGAPDAIGSELVTNGDFSDGSNDWTFGSAFSVVNGKAYYNDSASGNQIYQSNLTFDTSKNYVLTFDISDATDAVLWVGNSTGTNAYTISSNYNTYNNGHYYLLLRGSDIGASETTLAFWANPNGAAFSIDNISLKEVANCGTISGATWTHGIGAPVAQTSVIDWNKRKLEGESTTNEYLIPQGLTSGRDLLGNLFENVRKQGALNLDGNSWAEVHDNESLDFGTGSFTLEAWAKAKFVNQGSSLNTIMILGGNAATGSSSLNIISGLLPSFYYHTSSRPAASGSQNEGDWFHIVGVYDETNQTIYINGQQDGQSARVSINITNALVKQIGRDSTSNRFYTDQIAQPRIYNRALTAEEVQRSYDSGKNIFTNS